MTPKETICRYHYTRSWPSGKSAVYEFETAIIVFSIPANYNLSKWMGCDKNRIWELTRLWAPDGHEKNLLTRAIAFAVREFKQTGFADVIISYADPNAGHKGGVYRAASWTFLGQSEEARAYRKGRRIIPRRKFHSGSRHMNKAEILALGYRELRLPGKFRFGKGLSKKGNAIVKRKAEALHEKA